MPQGDPAGNPSETAQPKAGETVHSHISDAEKEARRLAFQRRQESKGWKKEAFDMVKQVALERGFDPNKKENEEQLGLITDVIEATNEAKEKARVRDNSQAASTILRSTMEKLGIDPKSSHGKILGQHLFSKHQVNNPDIYSNEDLVKSEMDNLAAAFSQKKSDPVTSEVIKKAGSPSKSSESRTAGAEDPKKGQIKETMARYGLSEEKAKRILALKEKQPSYAR